MSVRIMSLVWDAKFQSHTQKLVMLALADNANDDAVCWPSIRTVARKCGLTERAVYSHIERLTHMGLVSVESGGGKRSNRYTILLSAKPTPELRSPPPLNGIHPTPELRSPPPLNGIHPTPEYRSEEPSYNRQSKPSGGAAPRKFVREYQIQIESITKKMARLKEKHSDGDGTWSNTKALEDWRQLKTRKEQLEKEMESA